MHPHAGHSRLVFWGSTAMWQVGGERWQKWNEAMRKALVDHQRMEKDRCEMGSWDPIDAWSNEGGRVYATAMCCLCLETWFRTARMMDVPSPPSI